MTLDEAMAWADTSPRDWRDKPSQASAIVLAAEVRRLQSEVERLPARRAQPTVKSAPIAPTNWPVWGMVDETDEEFAERAGRQAPAQNRIHKKKRDRRKSLYPALLLGRRTGLEPVTIGITIQFYCCNTLILLDVLYGLCPITSARCRTNTSGVISRRHRIGHSEFSPSAGFEPTIAHSVSNASRPVFGNLGRIWGKTLTPRP